MLKREFRRECVRPPLLEVARMVEVQRAYELGQSFLEQEDQRIRMTITSLTR